MIKGQGRAARWAYWLYLIPGAALLVTIIIVPLGWNVYLSFTKYRGIKPPEWIGLDNWKELFHDGEFWASFEHSIAMVVAMVIIPTVIGLVLASLLFDVVGRRFNGKIAGLLRALFYLPQILPIAIAAILIGWILRPDDGALNQLLSKAGLGSLQHNWLGSPGTALLSIAAVLVWVQIGYPVVVFMSALQRIDPQLYEAAELDGANWFQRFRAITLSGIRPEIFVVVLTCTVAALKVFGPVYALTRGGPGNSTVVPSYYSYSEFFTAQRVGYGATIATALTVVVLVVAIFFVRAQFRLADQEES
jgi:raffinose/stachyose/melibiose transport system permease protein